MPKPTKPTHPTDPKPKAEFTIQDRFFNKRQDPAVQRVWLDKINSTGQGMTQWELKLCERIGQKLDNGWKLTEPESACLETIYADRTPN